MWQERVDGVFSASPVAGGGHVYFVSENGDTVVVKAGRAPQIVGRNALGERAVASPAASNGRIFIRTDNSPVLHRRGVKGFRWRPPLGGPVGSG